jgi:hypothetical protein
VILSKVGLKTLAKYLFLSIFTWSVIEILPIALSNVLLIIASVLSVAIWQDGISKSMEQGVQYGIVTALYFIIPYTVSIFSIYDFLFYDKLIFFRLPIMFLQHYLNYPLTLIPQQVSIEYKHFFVFEPLLIITVILFANIYKKVCEMIKS